MKISITALVLSLLTGMSRDPMITDDVMEEYDFIVVGAGAAGSVVARRLSDAGVTVLLLEAGKSDWGNPMVKNPATYVMVQDTDANWKYNLAQQQHSLLDMGKTMVYPGGKILGGSTSINAMIYIRGSPHDYDSWEDHGAKGWSWKDVVPHFRKVENAVDDEISDNVGRGGLLNLTRSYKSPFGTKILKAGEEIGIKEVDYFDDMEGISRYVCSRYKGMRQSSADAFLRPGYEKRKEKLHVVTNALVTKILLSSGLSGKSIATGVRYIKDGKRKTVKARKEVIVSTGAIKTPQLLMLSGIGPRRHLEDMGIKVVADLPGVGSNLQDHYMHYIYYEVNDARYVSPMPEDITEYVLNGTGFHAAALGVDLVFHHRTKYFGTDISLSTRKRPFPTLQTVFAPTHNDYSFNASTTPLYQVATVMGVQHPKSRGEIRLNSKNPLDQPIFDPKYLSEEDDVTMHIEGFREMEKFELSDTMKEIGFRMIIPNKCNGTLYPPRSDDFYRCFMKMYGVAAHACCTAKIGHKDDEMAVVDERLKVRNVERLRIADASVMPHITSSNTQAPCYMIGQKASEMIKEDWNI